MTTGKDCTSTPEKGEFIAAWSLIDNSCRGDPRVALFGHTRLQVYPNDIPRIGSSECYQRRLGGVEAGEVCLLIRKFNA
jgi:hypothetical protein